MDEPILGFCDLADEIARFPPGVHGGGRRAETLLKTGGLSVVLVTMLAGSLVGVAAGGRHAVRALEDGAFLLTIAGSAGTASGA